MFKRATRAQDPHQLAPSAIALRATPLVLHQALPGVPDLRTKVRSGVLDDCRLELFDFLEPSTGRLGKDHVRLAVELLEARRRRSALTLYCVLKLQDQLTVNRVLVVNGGDFAGASARRNGSSSTISFGTSPSASGIRPPRILTRSAASIRPGNGSVASRSVRVLTNCSSSMPSLTWMLSARCCATVTARAARAHARADADNEPGDEQRHHRRPDHVVAAELRAFRPARVAPDYRSLMEWSAGQWLACPI